MFARMMSWVTVGVWWLVLSQVTAWFYILRRVRKFTERNGYPPPHIDPVKVVLACLGAIPSWPILVVGMALGWDSD